MLGPDMLGDMRGPGRPGGMAARGHARRHARRGHARRHGACWRQLMIPSSGTLLVGEPWGDPHTPLRGDRCPARLVAGSAVETLAASCGR
eukprot:SM000176S03159  [mRNA]  locus=s176:301860:302241:- [translate_table: standard]